MENEKNLFWLKTNRIAVNKEGVEVDLTDRYLVHYRTNGKELSLDRGHDFLADVIYCNNIMLMDDASWKAPYSGIRLTEIERKELLEHLKGAYRVLDATLFVYDERGNELCTTMFEQRDSEASDVNKLQ